MTPYACHGGLVGRTEPPPPAKPAHLQVVSSAADLLAESGTLHDRLQAVITLVQDWLPAGVVWLFVETQGHSHFRVVTARRQAGGVPLTIGQRQAPGCASLLGAFQAGETGPGLCSEVCGALCAGRPAACNMNLLLHTATGTFGVMNLAGWTGPAPDGDTETTLHVLAHMLAQAIEAVGHAGPEPGHAGPVDWHWDWQAVADDLVQLRMPASWRIVARQATVHGRSMRLVAHAPEGPEAGTLAVYTVPTSRRSVAEMADSELAYWRAALTADGHDVTHVGVIADSHGQTCGYSLRRRRHDRLHLDTLLCVADGFLSHVIRVHVADDHWGFAADLEIARSLAVRAHIRQAGAGARHTGRAVKLTWPA